MGSASPQRDVPRLVALWQSGRLPVERLRTGTTDLDGLCAALDALHEGTAVRQLVLPGGLA
jgi:alcohol dehydrogenase